MTARHWMVVARQPDIVIRSMRVALVVGTILVLINHVDKIIALNVDVSDILKMVLTYLVPYCVSTHASVMTTMYEHRSPKRS